MLPDVTFEPLSIKHRDLIANWTVQPHVKQWWSEADQNIDSFFVPDAHEPFIAYVTNVATAYVQSWRPSKDPNYPWQHALAPTTRGIDLFIGPPDKIGRGFGTRIVRAFAGKLFSEGATRLVIDPDMRNERAIAAYVKAGFTPYHQHDGDLLMELLPDDFDYGAGYAQN